MVNPEVIVTEDDGPDSLTIQVNGVTEGVSPNPAFRLRDEATRQYYAPGGLRAQPYGFKGEATRDGKNLTFRVERSAVARIPAGQSLLIEIPEVAYRARFSWPGTAQAAAKPSEQPKLRDVLEVLKRSSSEEALAVEPEAIDTDDAQLGLSEPPLNVVAEAKPLEPSRKWSRSTRVAIGLSMFALLTVAVAGWQTYMAVTDRTMGAILLGIQSAALEEEAEKSRTQLSADREALAKEKADFAKVRTTFEIVRKKVSEEFAELNTSRQQLQQARDQLATERSALERDRAAFAESKPMVSARSDAPSQAPVISTPPNVSNQAPAAAENQGTSASINECDRLAANPNDWWRTTGVPGVRFGELNPSLATPACEAAVKFSPLDPRYKYQLARSLQKTDLPRATSLFEELVTKSRYPAAFDNLGSINLRPGGDLNRAIMLFRTGADLNDTDAMVSLASLIAEGKATARYPSEVYDLMTKASEKGNQVASILMAKMPKLSPSSQAFVAALLEIMKIPLNR